LNPVASLTLSLMAAVAVGREVPSGVRRPRADPPPHPEPMLAAAVVARGGAPPRARGGDGHGRSSPRAHALRRRWWLGRSSPRRAWRRWPGRARSRDSGGRARSSLSPCLRRRRWPRVELPRGCAHAWRGGQGEVAGGGSPLRSCRARRNRSSSHHGTRMRRRRSHGARRRRSHG
jgi:hypothetical protein